MKLPFILILDIDNTVIGNLTLCRQESQILNTLYKTCIMKKKSLPSPCEKDDILDIQDELSNGLLRPYTKDFIMYCEKKFKNLEVFFYTNSSYSWANGSLVREIEKSLKYKANRPIFTREDSIDMDKTLTNIAPLIQKSLVKKYPLLAKDSNLEKVFNERLVFIDDIKNNLKDYQTRQILCPAYNFEPKYDIYRKLQEKYNISLEVFDDPNILQQFENYHIPIHNKNGSIYQQDIEYYHIYSLYLAKKDEIEKKTAPPVKEDTFFKDLIKAFEKIDIFTEKEITKINNLFNK